MRLQLFYKHVSALTFIVLVYFGVYYSVYVIHKTDSREHNTEAENRKHIFLIFFFSISFLFPVYFILLLNIVFYLSQKLNVPREIDYLL